MSRLSIQLLSDLHLETLEYEKFTIEPVADTLAILGDIGSTNDHQLPTFLRSLTLRFRRILYVLGNNEFYFTSHSAALEHLRTLVSEVQRSRETNPAQGDLVLLDRTRLDLSEDLTILGVTLWSDLTHDPGTLEHITSSVGDFKHIDGFTPDKFRSHHEQDLSWLKSELAQIRAYEPHREVVVFSHHAPTLEGTSRPDLVGGARETAYATELAGTECWGPPVKVWAFGHTHWSCDFVKDGIRVVSNQRGRASRQGSDFDPSFVLQL